MQVRGLAPRREQSRGTARAPRRGCRRGTRPRSASRHPPNADPRARAGNPDRLPACAGSARPLRRGRSPSHRLARVVRRATRGPDVRALGGRARARDYRVPRSRANGGAQCFDEGSVRHRARAGDRAPAHDRHTARSVPRPRLPQRAETSRCPLRRRETPSRPRHWRSHPGRRTRLPTRPRDPPRASRAPTWQRDSKGRPSSPHSGTHSALQSRSGASTSLICVGRLVSCSGRFTKREAQGLTALINYGAHSIPFEGKAVTVA